MKSANQLSFQETVQGLIAGDFSRLAPLFDAPDNAACPIINWYEAGLFTAEPKALEEAFTCACFNGKLDVVRYLLAKQVDPSGGANTGLNAVHWAANRGQLDVVKLLLSHEPNIETRNMYGGTVLGATVWASANETRPTHPEIVAALIDAGADLSEAEYPSGNQAVDEILERHLRSKSNQADA
ncbi:MAG TPA: ankyrin repeat domain-containing protein [Pyrinomonadaceae bacterium]|nr:ankyrin repeat domain-containing protein [Pyrinomonadaceae bacterium]